MLETIPLLVPIGIERVAYKTPIALLGKHYWRCVVYSHERYGACTEWVFLRKSDSYAGQQWERADKWPSYNHNDGEYGGLPRGLRKIWDKNKEEIQLFLKGAGNANHE